MKSIHQKVVQEQDFPVCTVILWSGISVVVHYEPEVLTKTLKNVKDITQPQCSPQKQEQYFNISYLFSNLLLNTDTLFSCHMLIQLSQCSVTATSSLFIEAYDDSAMWMTQVNTSFFVYACNFSGATKDWSFCKYINISNHIMYSVNFIW